MARMKKITAADKLRLLEGALARIQYHVIGTKIEEQSPPRNRLQCILGVVNTAQWALFGNAKERRLCLPILREMVALK